MPAHDGISIGGVRLTHPDRVLLPGLGVTKRDMARYMMRVAPRMLQFVSGRLLTLVRCPSGQDEPCFFQRHAAAGMPDAIRVARVRGRSGRRHDYIYYRRGRGTPGCPGVLEFHVWGSCVEDVERPIRVVFDLDPGPGVGFADVRYGALRMREVLAALGLRSFPLLRGGKGVHVAAPIAVAPYSPRARAVGEGG